MKNTLYLLIILGISSFSCQENLPENADQAQNDVEAIKNVIAQYKRSINTADTVLGAKIWAQTPEVSFIHPRGHEKGWEEVKRNLYGMFRERFTFRDLKSLDEIVNVYDDVAWVEFYWVFDATFTSNNQPLQTKGRETQILKKMDDDWRIVHVHYSGMPVTEEGQGF